MTMHVRHSTPATNRPDQMRARRGAAANIIMLGNMLGNRLLTAAGMEVKAFPLSLRTVRPLVHRFTGIVFGWSHVRMVM
jgi:hypothetical protein